MSMCIYYIKIMTRDLFKYVIDVEPRSYHGDTHEDDIGRMGYL